MQTRMFARVVGSPWGTDDENEDIKAYPRCPLNFNIYIFPHLNLKAVFQKYMVNIVFKNEIKFLGKKMFP